MSDNPAQDDVSDQLDVPHTDPEQAAIDLKHPLAIYSSRHPNHTVQHAEGKMKDETYIEHNFQFENGVLRFYTQDDVDLFERALKKMHPTARHHITRLGTRSDADKIALQHKMATDRQKQAVNGPFTSSALDVINSEVREEQVRAKATAHGADGDQAMKGLRAMLKPATASSGEGGPAA